MSDESYYIVRGAHMACECGTHRRRINLPQSHGAYVNGKPMLHEEDNKPDNIPYFGICFSEMNQSGETIYLISEDGQKISGKPCMPRFMDKWLLAQETAQVDGKAALTTESFLVCDLMGKVYFLSTGQHED
ncbi:hypothetical protein D3C78_703850 [compost metagenome]